MSPVQKSESSTPYGPRVVFFLRIRKLRAAKESCVPYQFLEKGLHAHKHIQKSQFVSFGKDFSKYLRRGQMCHS